MSLLPVHTHCLFPSHSVSCEFGQSSKIVPLPRHGAKALHANVDELRKVHTAQPAAKNLGLTA